MEKKSKVIKGLVKAVHSGDYITIIKSSKAGPPQEFAVYLASITAPKIGSTNRTEEPFAFDAREFLREKVIGKKCEFTQEYNFSGRDYGTLVVNEENMNLALVKSGLVKVLEKKGNIQASQHYDELLAAQNEIKTKKIGLWNTDEKNIEKHIRNVTHYSDSGFSAAKLFEESKAIEMPLESIVEYVFNASFVSAYIHKFQTVVKVSMNFLFTPNNIDKTILSDGKAFTEKYLLHRTVGIKFEKVEEGGNLVGRIYHPAGDIATEVLKNGFSKLNAPKTIEFDAEYYKTLKSAQLIAQSKNLRIWKDFK
jgi:staphylococcal nuclease domain-containing protein 1